MEFLLWMLMFLTGWFVCWIQMSKSESQQIRTLKDSQVHLQQMYQQSRSEYLELQEQCQTREHLLESMFLELKKGKLEFPVSPAVFESQSWQSGYPEVARPDSTEEISR
jgi:hypothetical protein